MIAIELGGRRLREAAWVEVVGTDEENGDAWVYASFDDVQKELIATFEAGKWYDAFGSPAVAPRFIALEKPIRALLGDLTKEPVEIDLVETDYAYTFFKFDEVPWLYLFRERGRENVAQLWLDRWFNGVEQEGDSLDRLLLVSDDVYVSVPEVGELGARSRLSSLGA
jgi:hypothetical protein